MIGGHDPMAMPAPPELTLSLLGLTFVLHITMLGLLFSSLWARAGAEWGKIGVYDSLRVHRAGVVGFSMTITMGVPPLLFVQILYGKYFYASSISIGFPWLAVVGYLLVGFYALYWAQWSWMRGDRPSLAGKISLIVSMLCVAAIGFTYSWNHLKSLSSAPWDYSVSHAQAAHRLLGYFGAAAISSGAWASWFGAHWRTDKHTPRGAWIASTMGGISVLVWALTSDYALSGLGNFGHGLLLSGGALAILSGLIAMALGQTQLARLIATIAAPIATIGIFLQRESFRLATMRPFYDPFSIAERTQWSTVVMFGIAFLLGSVALIWLLRQIRRAPATVPPRT